MRRYPSLQLLEPVDHHLESVEPSQGIGTAVRTGLLFDHEEPISVWGDIVRVAI